jgi:UDP-N-acetylglucosamine--N-acetylmuramyl-(pentapeptide) pyrophosphoryl-undecaprenol N-acetylglucosamine transferase
MKILISGGGTGGHIFPAVAVADALKEINPDCEILFIGAEGKMEMEKIPKAGYEIIGLPIRGIQRKISPKNLKVPFQMVNSFLKVRKVIADFKPDIAFGTGGYASAPALKMAQWMGIPTAILESNNHPGLANRWLAKSVKRIFVAFEGLENVFPKDKIQFTGNPVRKDIRSILYNQEEAKRFFDWGQSKKTLLIFGGSLGARTINLAVRDAVEFFKSRPDIFVIWQTGKNDAAFLECETAKLPNVRAMQFIDRMDLAYSIADLVVCRAGALTISELAVVKKPAVLVPSPNVAEDHQTKNAAYLDNRDAAIMVPDSEVMQLLMKKN